MAKVKWPRDYPPDKTKLIHGIRDWVHQRNGGELYYEVEDLDRLTASTLEVIAMAMGFKPPAGTTERWAEWKVRRDAARAAKRVEDEARWARERAEREAEAEAMAKANVPKLPPSLSGL